RRRRNQGAAGAREQSGLVAGIGPWSLVLGAGHWLTTDAGHWLTADKDHGPGTAPFVNNAARMSDHAPAPQRADSSGFFARIKRGLFMTHTEIIEKLGAAVKKGIGIDESVLESLEEALIEADVGPETAAALTETVRAATASSSRTDLEELRRLLIVEIERLLAIAPPPPESASVPLE